MNNRSFTLMHWLIGSMVFLVITLFYLNLTGTRILGSNVEKWNPNGQTTHHK